LAEFYFVDTRETAKTSEPFAIFNADVAKIWAREYNAGEGPFQPVEAMAFGINRRDLKEAGENTTEKQEEAARHNAELSEDNPYNEMTKAELLDELEAREIKVKSKATNAELIALLIEDDIK
jgi:hypothetical protein